MAIFRPFRGNNVEKVTTSRPCPDNNVEKATRFLPLPRNNVGKATLFAPSLGIMSKKRCVSVLRRKYIIRLALVCAFPENLFIGSIGTFERRPGNMLTPENILFGMAHLLPRPDFAPLKMAHISRFRAATFCSGRIMDWRFSPG